jgi:hypothetical protein
MLTLIILRDRMPAGSVIAVPFPLCIYRLLFAFLAFGLRSELLMETLCQGSQACFHP